MGPARHEHTDTFHKHPIHMYACIYSTHTHTPTFAPVCLASPNYKAEWFDGQQMCSRPPWHFDLARLCTACIVSVCVRDRWCAWKVCVKTLPPYHRLVTTSWTLTSVSRFPLVLPIFRIVLYHSGRSNYGQKVNRSADVHSLCLTLIFSDQYKLLEPPTDCRGLMSLTWETLDKFAGCKKKDGRTGRYRGARKAERQPHNMHAFTQKHTQNATSKTHPAAGVCVCKLKYCFIFLSDL